MAFVLLPAGLRLLDIAALAAFIAAAEEDDDGIAIFAKVDAVAGAKEEAQFMHAFPHRFHVAVMALFQAQQPLQDAPPRGGVAQAVEPVGEGFITGCVVVNDDRFGGMGMRHERALLFLITVYTANYSLQQAFMWAQGK